MTLPRMAIILAFLFSASAVFPPLSLAEDLGSAIRHYQDGDYKKAIKQWQDLAQQGDADAAFNLGQVFKSGDGVSFDYPKAESYYRFAAGAGHTAAQRELANLLFFTYGTPDARQAAIPLWQMAAANGDGRAQYILGILYFNGDVVPQDKVLGYAWTLLAIDGGVPEALQSNTAMKSQLSPEEMGLAFQRAGILMTGTPNQGPFPFLVGEPEPHARTLIPVATPSPESEKPGLEVLPPVQTAEAEPESKDEKPSIEERPLVEIPGEVVTGAPMESEDEAQPPADEKKPEPEPEPANHETAEPPQDQGATAGEQTPETPPELQPVPEDEYDLGDPLSPLVDVIGFEGSWSVQLTSFRKPENAEAHWQDVLASNPDLFEGVEKRILRFDLGPGRGVYYRLRIGPFETKDVADAKCQAIKDAGLDCLVIWP